MEITQMLPYHLFYIQTSNGRKIRHCTARQAPFQGNYPGRIKLRVSTKMISYHQA